MLAISTTWINVWTFFEDLLLKLPSLTAGQTLGAELIASKAAQSTPTAEMQQDVSDVEQQQADPKVVTQQGGKQTQVILTDKQCNAGTNDGTCRLQGSTDMVELRIQGLEKALENYTADLEQRMKLVEVSMQNYTNKHEVDTQHTVGLMKQEQQSLDTEGVTATHRELHEPVTEYERPETLMSIREKIQKRGMSTALAEIALELSSLRKTVATLHQGMQGMLQGGTSENTV